MTNTTIAHTRTYTPEQRARMVAVLKESEERYRRELMDADEREVLRDRIIALKIRLARAAS